MTQATDHRNQLSEQILRVGKTNETPFKNDDEAIVRSLNQLGQTEETIKAIEDHMKVLQKREDEIVARIVKLSESINKGFKQPISTTPALLKMNLTPLL